MTAANYRTPSRATERRAWEKHRAVILRGWERGRTSAEIAEDLGPTLHGNANPAARHHNRAGTTNLTPAYRSPGTVRDMFQRVYNDLGLPPGQRTPASALARAYATGLLPCPCAAHEAKPKPPTETYLDRINRIRRGSGKV